MVAHRGAEGLRGHAGGVAEEQLVPVGHPLLAREPPRPGGREAGLGGLRGALRQVEEGEASLGGPLEERARDEEPVDLVGALEDPVHPVVPVDALDDVLLHEPIPAVDLDPLVGGLRERLRAPHLQDRGLHAVLLHRRDAVELVGVRARRGPARRGAPVDEAGGPVAHGLAHVGERHHPGELLPDQAEVGDGLPEGLPLLGVGGRELDDVPDPGHAGDAQLEPADVQDVEGDAVPLADLAEQVSGGDHRVLEDERARRAAPDPHLVLLGTRGEPGRVAVDDEGGELVAVDLGEDDEDVGEAGVGDPLLGAVQDPVLAVGREHGPGLGRRARRSPTTPRRGRRPRPTRRSGAGAGTGPAARGSRSRRWGACRCRPARRR